MLLVALLAVAQVVVQTHGANDQGIFSPDGRQVLVPTPGGSTLFDVASGRELRSFSGHVADSNIHGFSGDGSTVYTNSVNDPVFKAWDAATGALLGTLPNPRNFSVNSAGILPGSGLVAVYLSDESGEPQQVFYDGRTLRPAETLPGAIKNVTWFPHSYKKEDPRHQSPDGTLRVEDNGLYDLRSKRTARRLEARTRPTQLAGFLGNTELFTVVETTPQEPGENAVEVAVVWDLATLRPVRTFPIPYGYPKYLIGGKQLAIKLRGSTEGLPLAVVETQAGAVVRKIPMGPKETTTISFSANGKRFAWQIYDVPRVPVYVRDAGTGKELRAVGERVGSDGYGAGVAISPDGTRFAFASRPGLVKVAEVSGGEPRTLKAPGGKNPSHLAFAPDNRTLAVATGSRISLLDSSTGRILHSVRAGDEFPEDSLLYGIAFAPSGKTMVVAGPGGLVTLFDPSTGRKLRVLAGHGWSADSISFSPDEKRIATSGSGTAKLWDAATGALLATLLATSETDFAVLLPDGTYAASRGALQAIQFTEGMKVFPFESFDLLYNRPDKVLQAIGIAPSKARIEALRRAHERRLKMMGFASEPVPGELRLPEVQLAEPPPLQTAEPSVSLKVLAKGNGAALDRLNLYAEDVPVFGARGVPLSGEAAEKEVSVDLGAGVNHLAVSVLDARGVESPRVLFEVERTGPPPPRKLFVAAIGVSDYGRPEANLGYAAKDARDFASRLAALAVTRFAEVKSRVLTDKGVTREAVLGLREQLLAGGVDDEVILFVAGHGLLDEKLDWYFGTPDVDFNNPAARGLAWDELEGLLDGIPARRKLLLVDTCFSGEVDKGEVALVSVASPEGQVKTRAASTRGLKKTGLGLDGTMELVREQFADLRRGSGAVVISSAGGAEYALESSEWNNGVFTWSLLSGLSGAAHKDKDGTLRVSELRDYVVHKVTALTGGRQKPTARRENLVLDFNVY